MRTPCAVAPCLPFRPQLLPSLTLTLLSMPQFRLSQQLTALPCPWARLELAAAVELLTPQHWLLMQIPSPVKTVFWQLLLVRSCPSWAWWKKHQRPQRPTTPCSRPSRPSLVPVGQRPSPHPSTRSAQCCSMTAGHQRVKTLRAEHSVSGSFQRSVSVAPDRPSPSRRSGRPITLLLPPAHTRRPPRLLPCRLLLLPHARNSSVSSLAMSHWLPVQPLARLQPHWLSVCLKAAPPSL